MWIAQVYIAILIAPPLLIVEFRNYMIFNIKFTTLGTSEFVLDNMPCLLAMLNIKLNTIIIAFLCWNNKIVLHVY
jgi:hypothetical protein